MLLLLAYAAFASIEWLAFSVIFTGALFPFSLVGNKDGTLPTQRSIAKGKGSIELLEERWLCYVVMARAKTHLMLTL